MDQLCTLMSCCFVHRRLSWASVMDKLEQDSAVPNCTGLLHLMGICHSLTFSVNPETPSQSSFQGVRSTLKLTARASIKSIDASETYSQYGRLAMGAEQVSEAFNMTQLRRCRPVFGSLTSFTSDNWWVSSS